MNTIRNNVQHAFYHYWQSLDLSLTILATTAIVLAKDGVISDADFAKIIQKNEDLHISLNSATNVIVLDEVSKDILAMSEKLDVLVKDSLLKAP